MRSSTPLVVLAALVGLTVMTLVSIRGAASPLASTIRSSNRIGPINALRCQRQSHFSSPRHVLHNTHRLMRRHSSNNNNPIDMEKLMNDPNLAAQYKEAMNNPDIQRMVQEQMKIMQNPEFVKRIESMKQDPEMSAIFAELESGGMDAMMKYYNDPAFLEKLSSKMGDLTDIMQGGGAAGGAPPGTMPIGGGAGGAMPPGAMAGMDKLMQDSDMMQKFQALSQDPELMPMLSKIREGGPQAMQEAMSNPELLEKFQKKMDELGIDQSKIASATGGIAPPAMASPAAGAAAPPKPAGPEVETLIDAARYGDVEAAEDLTFVGKDVNQRDGEERTPMHWACAGGHVDVAKILLENGADLGALDSKGNTPLHYATGYGQPDAAKLLLDAGVDVSVKNANGKTSLDVVTLNPSNPISKLDDLMARLG
mmetsp:Transcript_17211/g.27956  ORF Transcript_17211/g.27956 Transcript_17211/m.27956 type:complete len:423 (+) Transcript_17211:1-1269(+)